MPAIVRAFAQSRAAKIESQHGNPASMQSLRGLVNNLVVHRAAEHRMRMADDAPSEAADAQPSGVVHSIASSRPAGPLRKKLRWKTSAMAFDNRIYRRAVRGASHWISLFELLADLRAIRQSMHRSEIRCA